MRYQVLIKSYLPNLTKAEKIVAKYTIENSEKILYQTLREVATSTNVGEATVLRFCNKIGCTKFAELKLMLAKDSKEEETSTSDNLLDKVSCNLKTIIENSRLILSEKNINKTIDLVKKSERLYFYGVGSSGISAKEAEVIFNRIGVHSLAVMDAHFQTIYASNMNKKDVIIAFSISGNTKDIYDSLLTAKKSGAKLIVITNYIESPIAKLSDIILLTAAKEHILEGGSTGGNIAQLFVVDCIKNAYLNKYSKDVKLMRTKIAENILDKTI